MNLEHLEYLPIALPALFFTFLTIVIFVLRRKIISNRSFWHTVTVFIPFVFFAVLGELSGFTVILGKTTGGGSGLALTAIFYFFFITLSALAGFLASFYNSPKNLVFFIVFSIFTILNYYPVFSYSYHSYQVNVGRGVINTPVTQEKAIEISKQTLKPGVNYQYMGVSFNENWSEEAAAWEVTYEIRDKKGEFVKDLYIMVNAKDGSIFPEPNTVEVEFTLLNRGKPAVDWEVITEWADPKGENSIVIHYVYDYGLTDQSGKVKLQLRNYEEENAYLFIIYNKGEYKNFYKINKPFKNSYIVTPTAIKILDK